MTSTFFSPYQNVISNITNSNPAQVTTASNHGYFNGLVVRLVLPLTSGMNQINNLVSEIFVVDSTNFTVSVDSTNFDAFIPPLLPIASNPSLAQVLPIGENALTLTSATENNNNIRPEL